MSVTRRDRKTENPCYFGLSGEGSRQDFRYPRDRFHYHSSRVQIIFNLGGKPIRYLIFPPTRVSVIAYFYRRATRRRQRGEEASGQRVCDNSCCGRANAIRGDAEKSESRNRVASSFVTSRILRTRTRKNMYSLCVLWQRASRWAGVRRGEAEGWVVGVLRH